MDRITQAKMNAVLRQGRGMIDRHGWMVQGVGGGGTEYEPSYCYSVGFSKNLGHPEVYMVGFPFELTTSLINVVGNSIKEGMRFDKACYSDVIVEGYPVAFMPLDRRSVIRHSAIGRNMLNQMFDEVQMFLPDTAGLFPWDNGCDRRYAEIQRNLLLTIGDPPEKGVRVPLPT